IFVTAGMGGGTGTGAAPVIAELGRRTGALVVGIITTPFSFEGPRRVRIAEEGIAPLCQSVDTLISIPSDRLLQMVEKRATLTDVCRLADDILRQGVQSLSDLITLPRLINVEFAAMRAIMTRAGRASLGIGVSSGDGRAVQ